MAQLAACRGGRVQALTAKRVQGYYLPFSAPDPFVRFL